MDRGRLWIPLLVLGALLALASAVLGLIVGLGSEWGSAGERALWFTFSLGGAVLLAAGLVLAARAASGLAVALIVVGALLCGLATFWSVLMPLAAVAVAVLAIMWGRRPLPV